MNKHDNHRILNPTGCPDQALLLDYLDGKTNPETTRIIELHLVDCPLCSDAVEGLSLMQDRAALEPILMETKQLLFGQGREVRLVLDGQKTGKSRRIQRGIYIGIAASLALIVVSYLGIRFLPMSDVQKETISMEDVPASKDNIKSLETPATSTEGVSGEEQFKNERNDLKANNPSGQFDWGGGDDATVDGSATTRNLQKVDAVSPVVSDPANVYSGNLESVFSTTTIVEDDSDVSGAFDIRTSIDQESVVEEKSIDEVVNTAKLSGEGKRAENKESEKKDKGAPTGGVNKNSVTPSQSQQQPQKELNDGLGYYNNGEYAEASDRFEVALDADPNQTQALYYNGMSLYYIKNYEAALKSFNTLLKDKKSPYYQATQWQIALIYIETGNTKQARKTLNEIIDGNGSYRFPAEEAIKNLGTQ